MTVKNIIAIVCIIVLSIGLVGCGLATSSSDVPAPETVVEKHFEYMNQKDNERLYTTLTPRWADSKIDWDFDNLESIEIASINEETEEYFIDEYLTEGRGKELGINKKNVKVLRVKYSVDYKSNNSGYNDGFYDRWFFLIRENKNSPWLIDDFTI